MTIDEKKARALFDMARGHSELGVGYKDADFELFKKDLDTDSKFQEDFRDDLVTAKLLSESIDIDTFRKGLKTSQPVSQPPPVSLAPPQRQSIEQQAAGQATGFVPPMAVQPEQPMQPDLGAKSGGLNLGRAFGGVAPVFQDEAQIKQEAQSPVFLANELAAQNVEGAAVSPTQQAVSASQRDFAKMSPEQQAQAIAGSTGSELAESKKPKPTLLQQGKQAISDIASSFNRSVFKAPSAIAKTVSELGTGAYNLMGGDAKVEQDYLYQIADKYDKWIDDSEFAKQFIGDKNVNSLAGDVGSGLGQIATMITAGGGSVAQGLKSAPSLLRGVAEKFLTPASGVAFSQVFSSEYDNMKAKGESDNTALKQALANAFVSAPLESIPLINLTERMNAINPSLARKVINTLAQGFDEMTQERLQQAFSNVTNNQLAQLESSIVKWSEGLDRSGEAGGLTGLIVGAIGQARIKRTKTPEVSGPSGQPPTQLGGIATIEAPQPERTVSPSGTVSYSVGSEAEIPDQFRDRATKDLSGKFNFSLTPEEAKQFEGQQTSETTYETVTPEELQAFRQGQIDPERAAAIADDVALIQSGQKDINSIDDANYRLMVESAMGAGQQQQQGTAIIPEQFQRPQITLSAPEITVSGSGNLFIPSLRKLGYTDEEISGMTMEQQQEIVSNRIEPARAADSSKVDVVKENAKQERLAEMNAELDREETPILPTNEQLPLADQAAQNMGTAVNQPLETGAAAVEVGESGRPVVEVEGDQVVEEEGVARKQKQLDIINKTNPAPNDQNTWVRGVEDILSPEEAFKDDDNFIGTPDFTIKDAKAALEKGEVIVYSSYPIKDGVFVTPSKMEAALYAGNKTPYSKKVKLTDVAWIDSNQGQYAEVKAEAPKGKATIIIEEKPKEPLIPKQKLEKIKEKVKSDPNVLLRTGKIEGKNTGFFAIPEQGGPFVDDSFNDLGVNEETSAYTMPNDFKVKDLSNMVFDDYKKNKEDEKARAEGYDGVKIMEMDGTTVMDVVNPKKLIKLDESLPELRSQQTPYQKSKKVEGVSDTRTLGDGTKIKGIYKIVSANNVLASHNEQTFSQTKGFPTTADGKTVNDRDYKTDTQAQVQVQTIAQTLDDRAIDQTPVVSKDGIVLDGNNRTMSRKLAATNKTDGEYLSALKDKLKKFGLPENALDGIENPMLVFELETDLPYTTETFAKFNKQEKKEKGPIEKAVELSKRLSDRFKNILSGIYEKAESPSDVTSDPKRIAEIKALLEKEGVLGSNEFPRYFNENNTATKEGVAFLETIVLASALNEETIRTLENDGMGNVRKIILGSIVPLIKNSTLKENSLIPDIIEGINYLAKAKSASQSVLDMVSQMGLGFAEVKPPSPEGLMIAITLEGGFKQFLNNYNNSVGTKDIFRGEQTKRVIIDDNLKSKIKNYEQVRQNLRINDGGPKGEVQKDDAEGAKGGKEVDGTTGSLTPFQTKDKEGQQARAELKERVGPAEYKRLENIAKNGEKILKDLQAKNVLKIDCP